MGSEKTDVEIIREMATSIRDMDTQAELDAYNATLLLRQLGIPKGWRITSVSVPATVTYYSPPGDDKPSTGRYEVTVKVKENE